MEKRIISVGFEVEFVPVPAEAFRSLDDYLVEKHANQAASSDPYHPTRRSKGDKHRNKSRRHLK